MWPSVTEAALHSNGWMEVGAVKQEINSWGFSAWLCRRVCALKQFMLSRLPASFLVSTWSSFHSSDLWCSLFLIRGKYQDFLGYSYCKEMKVLWISSWVDNSPPAWHLPGITSLFLERCCGNLGHRALQRQAAVPTSRSAYTINLKICDWNMLHVLT